MIRSKIKNFLAIVALIALSAIGVFTLNDRQIVVYKSDIPVVSSLEKIEDRSLVMIGDVRIPVELATNTVAIEKGLSGRISLDHDKGMLFVFEKPAKYRFWMPDMNFPIDIIWVNNSTVVHISKNVTNIFNKENPTFYTPKEPAQYVIEVNAGFSSMYNIILGDEVIFKNIPGII